jgi:hypothetical protein
LPTIPRANSNAAQASFKGWCAALCHSDADGQRFLIARIGSFNCAALDGGAEFGFEVA